MCSFTRVLEIWTQILMLVCQELNPLSHLLSPHLKNKMALEIEPRALSKSYRLCALSYVLSPLLILYLRQGFTELPAVLGFTRLLSQSPLPLQ